MRIVAVIPARGGSKGLPGKNIRPFAGVPLLAHAIAAARACPQIDRCLVSTDAAEIADVARAYDAEVPFLRPAALAQDDTPGIEPILHAVRWLEEHGDRPDAVMVLQPTSPLRTAEDLDAAIRLLGEPKADAVVSVCDAPRHPYLIKRRSPEGWLQPFAPMPKGGDEIRQAFPAAYALNGAVYLIRREVLLAQRTLLPERTCAHIMPMERSIDIDTAVDLELAEYIRARTLAGARGAASTITVAGRPVGPGAPCFIIAEAGVNHNGDPALARRLIEAAAKAGADAVKFQTFQADRLSTADAPQAAYQARSTGRAGTQRELLQPLELSPDVHRQLMDECRRLGILFLSTPFDEESIALLDRLGVATFKIASGELTNAGLLARAAQTGKPLILSTGMSSLGEVMAAVDVVRAGGAPCALLHCVSNYPAEDADVNLRAIDTMSAVFGLPIGYSDHTRGIEIAVAAVARGACIIEKHLTLDRSLPGPDHQASLEPEEFAAMVRGIRRTEAALGHGRKEPSPSEAAIAAVARRSLVAARRIPAGSLLTEDAVTVKRPGTGLPPAMRSRVVGRKAIQDIPEDTILTMDMLG
jgi:N-acetylneuraminate synthase